MAACTGRSELKPADRTTLLQKTLAVADLSGNSLRLHHKCFKRLLHAHQRSLRLPRLCCRPCFACAQVIRTASQLPTLRLELLELRLLPSDVSSKLKPRLPQQLDSGAHFVCRRSRLREANQGGG